MSSTYAHTAPSGRDDSAPIDAEAIEDRATEGMPEGTHESQHLVGLASLEGTKILNYDHEPLGAVADLMFDPDNGRISYVVIKSGGFLGLGEKHFAIPWGVVEIDRERHCLVVDADTTTFSQSPGFDPTQWSESRPDPHGENSWQERLHLHWILNPSSHDGANRRP